MRYSASVAVFINSNHNQVIAGSQDQELFFNALTHPSKPNDALLKAVSDYKELYSK